MDVTLVVNKLDLRGGGSNRSLELLARRLARTGNDVSVVTLNPKKNALTGDHPFTVIEAEPGRLGTRLGTHEQVYRVLERYERETDVYHVFAPNLLPGAGLYCTRDPATPVVGRLNNYNMFCVNTNRMDGECYRNCSVRAKFAHQDAGVGKRLAKLPLYASRTYVEPRLLNGVDRLFAISPTVGTAYEHNGVDGDLIDVVPNFYNRTFATDAGDATGTAPAEKDERQAEGNETRILFVGRLTEIKGVDVLVEALARLQRDDVVLDLVGDGDRRDALEAQVAEAGIGDHVTFHGWVAHENLPQYYDGADVFVHPGRLPEPFGRTLLEALQFDCPLVVSAVGAPPWVAGEAGVTSATTRSDWRRSGDSVRVGSRSSLRSRFSTGSKTDTRMSSVSEPFPRPSERLPRRV